MTNLQSLAGGIVWTAVAAILMLGAFEPVSAEPNTAAANSTSAAVLRAI